MNSKSDIRKHFRSQRRAFANELANNEICRRLLEHLDAYLALPTSRSLVIAAYLSSAEEVSLDAAINTLLAQGHTVAAPRINANDDMAFHAIDPEAIEIGKYGLRAPNESCPLVSLESLNVLLMPLVAFDNSGNRLGMGGGYYDRYLSVSNAAHKISRIGIAFNCQRATELPIEPHDIHLNAVVTESGWQLFNDIAIG